MERIFLILAASNGFLAATTDPSQIEEWWAQNPVANVGLATAGLIVIDIDGEDNPWPCDAGEDLGAGPTSLTPRGGRHHIYRQPTGREWRNTASRLAPMVDTRANGGYIVVPPSRVDGREYRWVDSRELSLGAEELPEPPMWLVAQIDALGEAAPSGLFRGGDRESVPANEEPTPPIQRLPAASGNEIPSGQRNDTLARLGGTMRRVGMIEDEIGAALDRINQNRCKPALPDGEVRRVASSICRYEPDQVAVAVAEDHWGQMHVESVDQDVLARMADPGPIPNELLRVPGFISEVMDHTLTIAPYPNQTMAFGGALSLQSVLAGRKVRDPGDNRTNVYVLGLAYSAAGKECPRQVNARILHHVGLDECLGERFASGEGIQDAMFRTPCMLFQTDEIDGMLQSINKAKDGRHEAIMGALLTLYSSANSVLPMRRRAGQESPGAIDQPCLSIFGTAIPNHFYAALSERMLTNGFFARTLVLECGQRGKGQEPSIQCLPSRVLDTAQWWAEMNPVEGNLKGWHPAPLVVEQTKEAKGVFIGAREDAEVEYAKAEANGDPVGTTVWGRASEHARKLALIYAASENHLRPEIGRAAAEWAVGFVTHQIRRMLFMAQGHVADSPFNGCCLKLLQKLRDAPDQTLPHSVLLKRMKLNAGTFQQIVKTLEEQGDVEVITIQRPGASKRQYRLRGESRCESETRPSGESRVNGDMEQSG